MTTVEFLAVDDIIALHDALLDEHGGQGGVRDRGLLESAVAMPMATFDSAFLHEDLFEMAAAYAFGIDLPEATEALHQAMLDVAARRLDKADLATLLEGLASPT